MPVYALFIALTLYFPLTYASKNWSFISDSLSGFTNVPHLIVLAIFGLFIFAFRVYGKNRDYPLFYAGGLLSFLLGCGFFTASAHASELLTISSLGSFTVGWGRSMLVLSILVFGSYCWGRILIANDKTIDRRFLPHVRIALGLASTTLLLFIAGATHFLNAWTVWFILILPCILRPGTTWQTLKEIHKSKFTKNDYSIYGYGALGLLLFFISSNFLTSLVPFPMGWDALGLYVNMASIIGDYGGLAAGHQAYNWSLLMSAGYFTFQSTEIALGISMLGGVLSAFAVFSIARKWLNANGAAWAALIFYTLPTISFQSTKDFKIDLGFLFISLTVFMLLHTSMRDKKIWSAKKAPGLDWIKHLWVNGKSLGFAAILCGYAFGIKYTAIFMILAFLATCWWKIGRRMGLAAFTALALYLVLFFQLDELSGLRIYHLGIGIVKWTLFGVGILLLGLFLFQERIKALKLLVLSAFFGLLVGLSFSPWIIKNALETKSLNSRELLFGQKTNPERIITKLAKPDGPIRDKVFVNQFTRKTPDMFGGSSKIEEIQRFIGYEPGLMKYLSIPVDISVGNNVNEKITGIGYLFAVFLPLFLMLYLRGKWRWIFLVVCALYISACAWGAMHARLNTDIAGQTTLSDFLAYSTAPDWIQSLVNAMRIPVLALLWPVKSLITNDHLFHYYATYPILFVGMLLVTLGMVSLSGRSRAHIRGLWVYICFYLFLWLILGGGIVWYGYFLIALAPIPVFLLIQRSGKTGMETVVRVVSYFLVGIWTMLLVGDRLFVLNDSSDPNKQILLEPFVAYQAGELGSSEVLNKIHAQYAEVRDVLNANPEGMIYRVGTFINFFVDRNDARIFF